MKRARGGSKSDKDSVQEEGQDSDAEVSFAGMRRPGGLLPHPAALGARNAGLVGRREPGNLNFLVK